MPDLITKEEFGEIQRKLGLSDAQLARALNVTRVKTVREYKRGEKPISGPAQQLMVAFRDGTLTPEY